MGGTLGRDGTEWFAADPRFDSAPQEKVLRAAGVANPNHQAPRVERGEASADNERRGPATQWANAAELSRRKRSSPFDLGASSVGDGPSMGANGLRGKSVASQGGRGQATKKGSEERPGEGATRASRSNPYFYAMYRRIDKELRFPKALAIALEQGEVVLRFRLDAAGQVHDLHIDKSSEFKQFDQEALRAFHAAGPMGRVPKAVMGDRSSIRVLAPYYFRNPLIR